MYYLAVFQVTENRSLPHHQHLAKQGPETSGFFIIAQEKIRSELDFYSWVESSWKHTIVIQIEPYWCRNNNCYCLILYELIQTDL